jgi:hypothetical protein
MKMFGTVFKLVERNWIPIDDELFSILLAVSTGLFAMESIRKARRTAWEGDDMMVASCLAGGIVLGFVSKID